MQKTPIWTIAALVGALSWLKTGLAATTQVIDNAPEICVEATQQLERRDRIPKHLLSAISLAESGRWNQQKQATVAWPWTVTAGGKGRFFDTKEEAVAEVEILMTEGVRNIDVGCMQINLFYHAGAFETLTQAFDPEANAAYASQYLQAMYEAAGDWPRAVGYYHSMTPKLSTAYREKVLKLWKQQGGRTSTVASLTRARIGIDHKRTLRLNTVFRARQEAVRKAEAAGKRHDVFASRRQAELDAWRQARNRGARITHLLAMRKAELKLRRAKSLSRLSAVDKEAELKAKRRAQLDDWRLKRANTGG